VTTTSEHRHPAPGDNPHRLDGRAIPTHYDLTIRPDADAGTFTGTVGIDLEVTTETSSLVCNAAGLAVTGATVTTPTGEQLAADATLDADSERVTFTVNTTLQPGPHRLDADFSGALDDRLRGMYRSSYTDAGGDTHHLVVTQFEATFARRAFPCWDEPAFKATFDISLVVPAGQSAVSNATEVARTPTEDGGHDEVQFATTMKMSTYLVAFVVGDLEATEAVDAAGVPLRVIHRPGQGHLASYALEVGAFCLDYFTRYYDIAYPGDKLDLVAIPDFAFGAMENLGCVTFREILLLVDPDEATQPELQNVTDVIAHELAHMWFGDLVTMDWWEGIWLNEAFATFMEMAATDAFRPDWQRWTGFAVARSVALDVDALAGTRPVEYPVVSPEEAEGMFDVLTYEKGAAVLRMLEQWLGPEEFRTGIRRYLTQHAYANTRTADLWDALEAATGAPVRRIAESWILQGGFPLVTVDLVDDGRTLRLGQEPFSYAGDRGEGTYATGGDPDRRWPVPVIITQGIAPLPDGADEPVRALEKVLVDPQGTDVDLVEPTAWLVGNTEGTGFYRVAYAPGLLDALITHAPTELSAVERYGVLDDAWAAVLADRLGITDLLDVVDAFCGDDDLTVWQRIAGILGSLDHLVGPPDAREALAGEVRRLVAGPLAAVGPSPRPGDADRTRSLRGLLTTVAGTFGADPGVRHHARELLADNSPDPGAADPALMAAAISVVASAGTTADFDTFAARAAGAETPQDELRYLTALADFCEPALMDRLLGMCVDGTVRTQNAPYLLRRALANRTQGERAWSFVSAEWELLNERFPSNSIARMLEGVRSLDTPAVAARVFAFFETHEVPQGDRIVAQHLERLEVNLALRARIAGPLEEHLRSLGA